MRSSLRAVAVDVPMPMCRLALALVRIDRGTQGGRAGAIPPVVPSRHREIFASDSDCDSVRSVSCYLSWLLLSVFRGFGPKHIEKLKFPSYDRIPQVSTDAHQFGKNLMCIGTRLAWGPPTSFEKGRCGGLFDYIKRLEMQQLHDMPHGTAI